MQKGCAPVVEAIGAPQFAGSTWGDFKRAVEACGIRDGDFLDSIEFGVAQFGTRRVVTAATDDGIEIREL